MVPDAGGETGNALAGELCAVLRSFAAPRKEDAEKAEVTYVQCDVTPCR